MEVSSSLSSLCKAFIDFLKIFFPLSENKININIISNFLLMIALDKTFMIECLLFLHSLCVSVSNKYFAINFVTIWRTCFWVVIYICLIFVCVWVYLCVWVRDIKSAYLNHFISSSFKNTLHFFFKFYQIYSNMKSIMQKQWEICIIKFKTLSLFEWLSSRADWYWVCKYSKLKFI